jgi:hypothetical protein
MRCIARERLLTMHLFFYIRLAEPYLMTFTSPFFAIFTMLDGW